MNKQKSLLIIFIFSGIGIIIMTLLMVFDSNENDINKAQLIIKANQMYEQQKYEEAIDIYNQLINIADDSSNNSNVYMAIGNAYYRLGSSLLEKQKMQTGQIQQTEKKSETMQTPQNKETPQSGEEIIKTYEQSLDQYRIGIEKDTNNLDIKFNYELVKKQLDDLKKEQEEKNKQNQDNDQNKGNQDNQDDQKQDGNQENKENQESKENDKENQDNKNSSSQNNEDNKQNQENQNNQQNENNQDKNQQDDEKEEIKENEQDQGKKDDNNKDKEDQEGKNEANNIDEKVNIDDEAIQQILKMLEQQEKESLKNNQAVVNYGEEETYDW